MQILVVEDSPVYRQLLASHLQEWGYPFTITKDGSEAWTLLQRPECPKLVLLDWVLPDIDGIELCRRIRRAGTEDAYRYIILLTGKDSKKDMLEAMQAGADDYMVKPFDQLELKARLLAGERIVILHEELVSAKESMRYGRQARDPLTGLLNRGEAHRLPQSRSRAGQAYRETAQHHLGRCRPLQAGERHPGASFWRRGTEGNRKKASFKVARIRRRGQIRRRGITDDSRRLRFDVSHNQSGRPRPR